jgi:hypothetical protein
MAALRFFHAVQHLHSDLCMQLRRTAFHSILVSALLHAGVALGGPEDVQMRQIDPHNWKSYTNVRFQYHICYPADLLVPQGEPDNSDGQKFLAHDGAQLIVYGSNNALNESLKEMLASTASRLTGASGKVTYKALKRNWFVVSGENEGTIFYSKVLYSHGQFKSFELTYDRSAGALYGPVIAHLVKCFTDLD